MYREILRQIERDGYHARAGPRDRVAQAQAARRGAHAAAPAGARAAPGMSRPFRALFGALVATQLVYGKVARLRTPAGTKAIVGLLLGASTADAVGAARRAARRGARRQRGRAGLRDRARGRRDGAAVRALHVLRRCSGARSAASRSRPRPRGR